jgi:hypothetical protein
MDMREKLIAAVRATAERLGRNPTLRVFHRETGFHSGNVYGQFDSWRALLTAAGLTPDRPQHRLADDEIFQAMLDAFASQGSITSINRFARHFRHSAEVLRCRGWSWGKALVACRNWALAHAPGHPMLPALERRIAAKPPPPPPRPPAGLGPDGRAPRWTPSGGRALGEVVNFRGMLHAPTTEQEVVAVFALVARDLDFLIESIRTGFPDCEAKRRVGGPAGPWQRVRVEIEYLARNFVEHNHDPKGCEVLVCWRNNWPDSPIEVIALEPLVKALAKRDAEEAEELANCQVGSM